ncbi:MAG TPA: dATP/dGTP diphosphohydrolase domain-containing protein, partial [Anaerovoracaceae bacterium]|nr:dATP/dGTP diphosphohydrolase domain-containing protein [Anaerovoracaceae bacterium]
MSDTVSSKPTNPKDIIGTDKVPLNLVPGTTMAYLALGHLEGHLKYGRSNWREAGIRMSIYLDALQRHVKKMEDGGEWEDPVTKVPHLANAITCLSIIIDAYECDKLVDDRPKSAPTASVIDRFSEKV